MITPPVRYQHHRFLLVNSLLASWCVSHLVPSRILGLWPGQFRICLACDLDHRYLWKTHVIALHLPTYGVDPACGGILFLDSTIKQGTLGIDRHVYLLVCCVLFARRRPSGT